MLACKNFKREKNQLQIHNSAFLFLIAQKADATLFLVPANNTIQIDQELLSFSISNSSSFFCDTLSNSV